MRRAAVTGCCGGRSPITSRRARSVKCSPDQVIITTGIHQSIDLAVRLLSDIGDRAWVEEPCYWGVRSVLQAAGSR